MPELAHKRHLASTVYATPLMTLNTALGLSIRVSMVGYVRLVTGTSSACRAPGPLEWAKGETVGVEPWVLKRRTFPGFVKVVHQGNPASRGYPLSVRKKIPL